MFLTPPRVEAKSIPEQKVRSGKKGRRGWGYAENSARRVTVGVCPGQGTGGFEIALAELADSHRSPTLFPFIWLQGIRIQDSAAWLSSFQPIPRYTTLSLEKRGWKWVEMGPVIERARKSLAALCHGRPANFSCQRVPVEEIESRLSGMGHTLLLLPSVNRGRKS